MEKSLASSERSQNSKKGKGWRLGKFLLFSLILGAVILATQTYGLAFTGFSEADIQSQAFFYVTYAAIALMIIVICFVYELITIKDDNKFGNGNGYTEQGEYPSLGFFRRLSLFQIFLISLIIFMIFGIFAFTTGQTVFTTGVKTLPTQQFTQTQSLAWSALLIPISENLGAAALICMALVALRIFARRQKWNSANFRLLAIIGIAVLVGLYGVANHQLHYQGNDTSLFVVFIFWTVGGFLTLIIGSFIPFWMMHLNNNLFFDLRGMFSKDLVTYSVYGIIALLIILYLWLYVFRKKKKPQLNI